MIIKRIELENFRQFKDRLKIDFNTDGRVTVITANNGVGKSTLLQAFSWLLYGKASFKSNNTNEKDYAKDDILYNSEIHKELSDNEHHTTFGLIEFENDDKTYTLERSILYEKKFGRSTIVNVSVNLKYKDPDLKTTITVKSEDIADVINSIIPEALSEYFLFDGEKNTLNAHANSGQKLKNSIYQIFDLDIYINMLDIIGMKSNRNTLYGLVNQSKRNELSASSGDDLQEEYAKRDKAESDMQNIIKENQKYNSTINFNNLKIEEINTQLLTFGDAVINKLEKERENTTQDKIGLEKSNDTLLNNVGDNLAEYLPQKILQEKAKRTIDIITQRSKEVKTFIGVKRNTLEEILKIDKCVCGRQLDDESRKNIQSLLDGLPPKSFKSSLEDFKDQVYSDSDLTTIEEKINEELASVSSNHILISKFEDRLKEINKLIKSNASSKKLEEDRDKYIKENRELSRKIGANGLLYTAKEKKYKNAENNIEAITKNNIVSEKYNKYETCIDNVASHIGLILQKNLDEIRAVLNESMVEVFSKMSSTHMDEMYLNEDFEFITKAEDGTNYKSGGQEIVDMYAYIAGLLKALNKTNIDKEFPLIIDAPFTKIDNEQLPRIVSQLKSISSQTIFFTFDIDRLEIEDKNTYGKIWYLEAKDDRKRDVYARLGGE